MEFKKPLTPSQPMGHQFPCLLFPFEEMNTHCWSYKLKKLEWKGKSIIRIKLDHRQFKEDW